MDKRVEIHGTSRADMNGKHGVALDFHCYTEDRTKDRYTVQFDSGEAFKVKPANVPLRGRVVRAAGAEGQGEEGQGRARMMEVRRRRRPAHTGVGTVGREGEE